MAYYYSGTSCTNSADTYVFSSDLAISLPTIVSFTGNEMLNPVCVTLTSEVPSVLSSLPIVNTFTTCQDCMRSLNPCPVFLTECESGQVYPVPYSSIYSLPFVPQTGNVYLVTVLNGVTYTQSCFFIERYTYSPGGFFCKRPNILYDLISISPSSFGLKGGDGCEICQNSSPSYWRVKECISNTEYIISLSPGTNYQGYAITFTIDTLGIDLYCGVIIQNIPFSLPTSFVSSIIGYVGEGSGTNPEEFCVSCVASGATKVLISNCLDGSTEVIWGSNLFNPGDVSNISLGGGQCYEVLSATTAPVTINELLNYEPSPTCTDCLNCEQVELFVQVCGDITAFPIISSQYVPFGTIISDGSTCYEVQNASPVDVSGVTTIVSFATFNTCPECEDASFQRWVGTSCNDGHADFIVLTGTSSYVPGQIVQVQRNGSDFTCYTLQYTAEGEVPPLLDTPNIYYSLTQTPYNTCAECSSGSTVGITIIDCDYASASYVTVSLYDYLRLTGGDGNPATPVLQYDGECHLLLNECPIDNTYPLVTSNLYNNCIECSADLNVTRYSGTTCFSQEPIIIAYNETNILTPGDIVITNGGTCVTISGITELTNSEGTITLTGLTSCYECYLNDDPNYQVFFQQCLTNEIYFIPLSSIGFLPTLGQVYFLDFTYGKEQILHQTCFTVIDLQPQQPDEYMSFNSISLPYVDCAECFTNNLIRYRVQDCVSGDIHVIGYPSTGLVNLVTYTPIGEVDQYCGIVLEITTSEPIDSSLITILGKVDCEECLSAVAKKRILTNCLNGNQEVVWGSLLFAEGNITHIQTGEGCYEIGPETELEVTINEFLDFDNYPSCQECIQCNGVHYFYSACTPNFGVLNINTLTSLYFPRMLQFDQTNNILWITTTFDTQITKFDTTTNTILATYGTSSQISFLFFLHPSNGFIYYQNSGQLYKFNTTTGVSTLIYTSPYGGNFTSYFYDSTTDYIWLTNYGSNFVLVLNLTTQTIVTSINVSQPYPSSIVLNTSSNKVYVSDYYNGWYYIIDRTTFNVDSTIASFMYYSWKLFYDSGTNRIFGTNVFIDCNINQVFSVTNYIQYDAIKDPISGKLIVPYSNVIFIFDPIYLTISQVETPIPNGQYNFVQYNSVTNKYYFAAGYGSSVIEIIFGDIYNIGEIDSYQYTPLDSYFFHPKYGCSVVYDILPSSGITAHNFYSFETFETCEDCTNVQFDVWDAYNCVTGQFGYVVTTSGSYNSGDLVNVKWGETDFVCFELNYKLEQSQYQDINLNRDFYFSDSVVKPSCENCSDGVSVSISIIDCSNQNSMFVNVSLSLWFILTGYNDTIPRPVFLFGDTCYKVLNECPFSPDHYPINPTYIYYNCESCGNPLEANSETVLCLQNCSGGTYTVSVNHPYWTNQYGMAVIQNNAVGLGGQTGYNA